MLPDVRAGGHYVRAAATMNMNMKHFRKYKIVLGTRYVLTGWWRAST